MVWQLNPYAIPFILTTIPLGYCAHLAWRSRSRLPERLFLTLTVSVLWLIALYSARLLTSDPDTILWLAKLEYPVNQVAATIWLLFNLAYVGYDKLINRRTIGLLSVFPLTYMALVWTNEFHQLDWTQVGVHQIHSLVVFNFTHSYSLFFWLSIAYVYLILLAATVTIVLKLSRAPENFRHQSRALLLASLLPWAAAVVDLTGLNPSPVIDFSSFSLVFSVALLAWSLFRFRLLDIAPTAHDMIVRSMSDAVLVLDLHNCIIEANPAAAALMDTSLSAVIGKQAGEISHLFGDRLPPHSLTHEVSEEVTCILGGEPRTLDVRLSPLRDPWSAVRGRIMIVRDITEHRRAEQQAAQLALEKEKVHLLNEFIDITSHDLNTPLTTLRISSDLLRIHTERLPPQIAKVRTRSMFGNTEENFADLEKLIQSIVANGQRVNESTNRLQRLVGEMLEMIRLDRHMYLDATVGCLNKLAEEIVSQLGLAAAEKAVRLTFTPDPQLPKVRFDAAQLSTALRHMVRNAVTYTPVGGAIHVRTFAANGWAMTEVSDTGVGISAEDLPHIFERFYRVDKARNTQTGGMGLGLAIVKKVIDAHEGLVEVDTTLDQGSTFRIGLPIDAP
jgi:PAS domain S-box-containing protein